MYKSDSVKAFNESFTRASRERGGIGSYNEAMLSSGSYPESLLISEKDFNLYEQFSKGNKRRGLGGLFKVKLFDEEK